MSSNTIPCPHPDKCGVNSHIAGSDAHQDCIKITLNQGRGTGYSSALPSSPPPVATPYNLCSSCGEELDEDDIEAGDGKCEDCSFIESRKSEYEDLPENQKHGWDTEFLAYGSVQKCKYCDMEESKLDPEYNFNPCEARPVAEAEARHQEMFDKLNREYRAFDDMDFNYTNKEAKYGIAHVVLGGPNFATSATNVRTDGPLSASLRNVADAYAGMSVDELNIEDYIYDDSDIGFSGTEELLKDDEAFFHEKAEELYKGVGRWEDVKGAERIYSTEFQNITGTPPALNGAEVYFPYADKEGTIHAYGDETPYIIDNDGNRIDIADELPGNRFWREPEELYQIQSLPKDLSTEDIDRALDAKLARG